MSNIVNLLSGYGESAKVSYAKQYFGKAENTITSKELIEIISKISNEAYRSDFISYSRVSDLSDHWLEIMELITNEIYRLAFTVYVSSGSKFGVPNGFCYDTVILGALKLFTSDLMKDTFIGIYLRKTEPILTGDGLHSILSIIKEDHLRYKIMKLLHKYVIYDETEENEEKKSILSAFVIEPYISLVRSFLSIQEQPPKKKPKLEPTTTFTTGNEQFNFYGPMTNTNISSLVSGNFVSVIGSNAKCTDNTSFSFDIEGRWICYEGSRYGGGVILKGVTFNQGPDFTVVVTHKGVWNLTNGSYKIDCGVVKKKDGTSIPCVNSRKKVIEGEVTDDDVRKEDTEYSNKKGKEELEESKCCVICMDREIRVILFPCRHMKFCTKCALDAKKKGKCPVCREPVENAILAYN